LKGRQTYPERQCDSLYLKKSSEKFRFSPSNNHNITFVALRNYIELLVEVTIIEKPWLKRQAVELSQHNN